MTLNPSYAMNANTLSSVIADLQMTRDSARRRAVKAYDADDLRAFEYWTGQADGLAEAVDRLLLAQGTIVIRNMTGKDEQ